MFGPIGVTRMLMPACLCANNKASFRLVRLFVMIWGRFRRRVVRFLGVLCPCRRISLSVCGASDNDPTSLTRTTLLISSIYALLLNVEGK